MTGCRAACLHRSSVESYHLTRWAQEQERDAVTLQYSTEEADYNRTHDMITYKRWLQSGAGFERAPESATG